MINKQERFVVPCGGDYDSLLCVRKWKKKKNRVVEATTGKMILGKMHNGIPIEYSTGSTRDSSTTRF